MSTDLLQFGRFWVCKLLYDITEGKRLQVYEEHAQVETRLFASLRQVRSYFLFQVVVSCQVNGTIIRVTRLFLQD